MGPKSRVYRQRDVIIRPALLAIFQPTVVYYTSSSSVGSRTWPKKKTVRYPMPKPALRLYGVILLTLYMTSFLCI